MDFRPSLPVSTTLGTSPDDTVFVRRALRSEIPAISDLVVAGLSRFRDQMPDAALDLYIERSRDISARWDAGTVLAAYWHGRLAGTVTWYPQAGLGLPATWANFGTLVVDPGMSRRGIGSILVHRCIAMTTGPTSTIGIHTGSFMQSARRMYEAMGFARLPEHDHRASSLFGFDPAVGDIDVLAYRLDLASRDLP